MREFVRAIEPPVLWEPNGPEARLIVSDVGSAMLTLNAHPDDEDQRAVRLIWSGVQGTRFGPPNDEGLIAHDLYRRGLQGVLWMGLVENSTWREATERMVQAVAERHYVVLTKEALVEVLGNDVRVERSTR